MPISTSLPLPLPLPLRPPQHPRPLSTTTLSQQTSPSSSSRALTLSSRSTRPQREAATKARKRVVEAYTLYPFERDSDADSDGTPAGRSAPRHKTIESNDSSDSDSDVFVEDSGSDCPRLRKVARGKKRKRSVLPMMDGRSRRKFKAGRMLHVGDGKRNENATGFMVKSGNVVKDILRGKTSRGPRDPLWEQVEREYRGHIVRRAGLSDMGPAAGSYKTMLAG